MGLPANVIRVDRDRQRVEVMPAGMTRPIEAAFSEQKRPPPPCSQVYLEQAASGLWKVTHGVSQRSVIFHDDFGVAVTDGVSSFWGDTTWETLTPADLYSGSGWGGSGEGVAVLYSDAGTGLTGFWKDLDSTFLEADTAYWLSSAFRIDNVNSVAVELALEGPGSSFTDYANAKYSDISPPFGTGNYYFESNHTGYAAMDSGTVIDDTDMHTLEIVMVPDSFVAGWVDGDGPYFTDDDPNVFTEGSTCTTFFRALSTVGAVQVFIDWIHFEKFTNAVGPSRLYSIGASGPLLPASPGSNL